MNLFLISCLLIFCRAKKSKSTISVDKLGKESVYCKCGEKIIQDGKHNWIQRLVGSKTTIDGLKFRDVFLEVREIVTYKSIILKTLQDADIHSLICTAPICAILSKTENTKENACPKLVIATQWK